MTRSAVAVVMTLDLPDSATSTIYDRHIPHLAQSKEANPVIIHEIILNIVRCGLGGEK